MLKSIAVVVLSCLLTVAASAENLATGALGEPQKPKSETGQRAKEVLTDAAIVAFLIAASVAAYKAMGKPCAVRATP